MPAAGDQHTGSIANPFEEPRPLVSQYTADEIAMLQYRLDKQLGPEYISNRQGPGGSRVHYLAADKVINLANEVLGFNGWSSSIQNIQVDFVDENAQTSRVSLGLSVIVRVTLRDGTFHEDVGYGHIENAKGKAAAFEKAKKEGTTDALKRALRNFGNVLGNCVYDKEYLSKVSKVKPLPQKFEETNLYRHGDRNRLNRAPEPVVLAPVAAAAPPPNRPASVGPGTSGMKTAAAQQISARGGQLSRSASPALIPDNMSMNDDLDGIMDDIDDADLCMAEEGHPDEVILPAPDPVPTPQTSAPAPQQHNQYQNYQSNNAPPQPGHLQQQNMNRQFYQQPPNAPQTPVNQNRPSYGGGMPQNNANNPRLMPVSRPQFNPQPTSRSTGQPNGPPPGPSLQPHQPTPQTTGPAAPPAAQGPPPSETVGFFSARAVSQLPETALTAATSLPLAPGTAAFNPKAESPSIRKTPGIDHSSSKPTTRTLQHVPPSSQSQTSTQSSSTQRPVPGFARGGVDGARRIGAPGMMGSPHGGGNRGAYRPPTIMKRGAPQYPQLSHQQQQQNQGGGERQALSEVAVNVQGNPGTGPDNKRPRLT